MQTIIIFYIITYISKTGGMFMAKGTTVRMWRRSMIVLIALVAVGFGLVIFRLAKLQLIDGNALQKMALEQQLTDTKINAQRGTIYDCNMKPLAQSATVWTVVLEPAYLKTDKDKELVCDGLSRILDIDKSKLLEQAQKKSFYTVIKRKVETDVKEEIIKFKNDNNITNGIRLIEDYKRYYPFGKFAASVIGFTGTDSQGLSGLEAYYDEYLTGKSGRLVTAKNAIGTDMPFDYEQMIPAQDGYGLVLCIDEAIQHFLEKSLEEGIANNKVKNRATAIAMDVNTGAILGMAVKDDFDPNDPFTITDKEELDKISSLPKEEQEKAKSEAYGKQWRNKAISDTYYPGSVFKMVTASMGFEENVVSEDTTFTCTGGIKPYQGASYIKCWRTSGHGTQTFVEALCNSCNPTFIMLGQKIGEANFYKYYSAFGFSEKTGIDLPGEAKDIFFSKDGSMSQMDLAVASFGQNFSITPIQMVTAASAIANGGKLVKPHIVSRIIDKDGNIVKNIDTQVKRTVISEDTARRVSAILHRNATVGVAKNGYVPGYRIAGKTGTSEKIGSSGSEGMDYIASYCGFAPADNPQVAILMFFDTPKGDSYYGGAVAGPPFAKAMQDILSYLGVERQYTEEEMKDLEAITPNIIGKKLSEAKHDIESAGLVPIIVGGGDVVLSQIPEPTKQIPKGGSVVIYTDNASSESKAIVPNLVGLSMTEVNRVAAGANVNIKIQGPSGEVISSAQSIPEGTEVKKGTVVTVEFIQRDQVQ